MAILSTKHNDIIISGNNVVIGNLPKQSFASFIEEIAKEVEKKPKVVQKRFFKILKNTYLLAIPLLATSQKAHATEYLNVPLLDKAYGLDILPDEIVTILMQVIVATGIIGVGFAILCLMIAGGYRMFGHPDRARGMTTDAIKGLGQILLAPVIILILVTLTSLVFRNVPSLDIFF